MKGRHPHTNCKLGFIIHKIDISPIKFPWHQTQPNQISFMDRFIVPIELLHLFELLFAKRSAFGTTAAAFHGNHLRLHHRLFHGAAGSDAGHPEDDHGDHQQRGNEQQKAPDEIVPHTSSQAIAWPKPSRFASQNESIAWT